MTHTPDPQHLVEGLVKLLTVEKRASDVFMGSPQKGGVGRVFGGQVVAQALQAAQATIPDAKVAHSLHAYFLRGGREGAPIEYRIARDFDGRSFANRRVVASQENEDGTSTPILNLTASFQVPERFAEQLALNSAAALEASMSAAYPQIRLGDVDMDMARWLDDALKHMPHCLLAVGHPAPRENARGG